MPSPQHTWQEKPRQHAARQDTHTSAWESDRAIRDCRSRQDALKSLLYAVCNHHSMPRAAVSRTSRHCLLYTPCMNMSRCKSLMLSSSFVCPDVRQVRVTVHSQPASYQQGVSTKLPYRHASRHIPLSCQPVKETTHTCACRHTNESLQCPDKSANAEV